MIFDFESVDGSPFELARRYLFGPAVDQILAQENLGEDLAAAARVYWLLEDNQGTVRDIADNQGNRIEHYKYSAFGALLEGDPTITRYLYTAQEYDAATDLQYFGGRWYSSQMARFLNEDRVGFRGGDYNLYRLAWNSPTNYVDHYGTWAEPNGARVVVGRPGASGIQVTQGSVYDPSIGGADAGADSLWSPAGWWGFFTGWERRARGDGTYYWRKFSDPYTVNPETGNLQAPVYADRAFEELGNDVQNGIAIGGAVAGKVPNPHGKLGSPAHRSAVAQRAGQLEQQGYTIEAGGGKLPERAVITPEGLRRFPDISARSASGKPYYENIGKNTRSGQPIARERRALEDIGRATGTRPGFTPY